MTDERQDYTILISLATREEAEVMASALRAEGIDAFTGNGMHVGMDWHLTMAMGGVQVLVPGGRIDEAKAVIRERMNEAAGNTDAEPVARRDRWKMWAVMAYAVGAPALIAWLPSLWPVQDIGYQPGASEVVEVLTPYEPETNPAVYVQYCQEFPSDSVQVFEDGVTRTVGCSVILGFD